MADESSFAVDPGLERLVESDEAVKRFHADIRDANLVIRAQLVEAEDIAELAAELDEEWPYFQTTLVVSGKVYDEKGKELFVEGQEVVSFGVDTRDDEEGLKLYHYLGILEEGELVSTVWVDAEEEDLFDVRPAVNIEDRAAEDFVYYYPGKAADLKQAILDSDDVTEAVRKLSAFVFDHDPEKVDPDEFRIMVESYLRKLLVFKEKVPYSVAFKGSYLVIIPNDEGNSFRSEKAEDWQKKLATPISVILISMSQAVGDMDKSNDKVSTPALLISAIDPETSEEQVMAIPISRQYFKFVSNMEKVKEGLEELELE